MRYLMNSIVLSLVKIICIFSATLTTAAQSETLVESYQFFRIYGAFSVNQKAAQAWLPVPWKAVSLPNGHFKGANLYILFNDKYIVQDAEGKPYMGGIYCNAVLIAFGKNEQTGEFAPFVTRIYSPQGGPGPYKNAVEAKVFREATIKSSTSQTAMGSEMWKVEDSTGGILEFQIKFQRSVPERKKYEFKVRSSFEPDYFRIYRDDAVIDIIKSITTGIDRLKDYKLHTTISDLRKIFDGSEQLVGISVNPIHVRQVFLP